MNEKEKISLNDVKALRESQDEMLRELYKEKYLRTNSMVAQVANSGNNTSYLCVVKNDWAANNLKLFFQMDSADKFVSEEIGPNGETTYSIEIDNASSEEFKQRMPDHSRADLISRYLITQPNRQLPTIMAVVEADWVTLQPDDPRYNEYWDEEGRAKQDVITPTFSLDEDGNNVMLNEEQLAQTYVIDGAHRLLAIRNVKEIEKNNNLASHKKDGTILRAKNIDDVAEEYKRTVAELFHRDVLKEDVSLQLFNAVQKGETLKEATRRTRSLFVHVNKTAKPPTAGENILLDDDDGFAITARAVAFTHGLFKKNKQGDRIDIKVKNLPINSANITTLSVLTDCAKDYLEQFEQFKGWKSSTVKEITIRPDDVDLDDAKVSFTLFCDKLSQLKIFKDALNPSKDPDDQAIRIARKLVDPKNHDETKHHLGHLLARPLGQRILASAVGKMMNEDKDIALDVIFSRVKKFDESGGFEQINSQKSIFYGIVYDPLNEKMLMGNRELASNLLVYVLRGQVSDLDVIAEKCKKLRTQDKTGHYDFNGNIVPGNGDINIKDPENDNFWKVSEEPLELPDQVSA